MKTVSYSDYLSECNNNDNLMIVTGRRNKNGKREGRPIKESRFNRIRDNISGEINNSNYKSREEAKADLEIKIQKMDPITFFLLRAVIGWLIGRILDLYFVSENDGV